ncbi:Uncharacterized protein TCM_002866 [Theobroma cacao]|uniref:Putative plant transposon protein domain-containing protein n=1 Tax=Theobroma cacao TaxID=3641 RepID=A0A061DME4_THECC|nr:Uncharacterized protein TCM_002866 [Theobroma cacao]
MSKVMPVSFKSIQLHGAYKCWLYFVVARMLPVKHVSDITKDKALLLYCILIGKAIDIGRLIYNTIFLSTNTPREGIWFPSLIIELCKRVSVKWGSREKLLYPKGSIDDAIIEKFMQQDLSTTGGSSSTVKP